MSIQVLAKANVVGKPIDAVYQERGDDSPMLVFGKAEVPERITLTEFIEKINDIMPAGNVTDETIKNALPESILEGVSLSLNHVYFVKEVATDSNKKNEYAFWVNLHLGDLTKDFPTTVESISFKFWSTANSKILEEMKINEIEELLVNAGITPKEID